MIGVDDRADVYLAEINSDNGEIVWNSEIKTNYKDGIVNQDSLKIDKKGNIYLSGYTSGTFKGEKSYGASDVFLAKFKNINPYIEDINQSTEQTESCSIDSERIDDLNISLNPNWNSFIISWKPNNSFQKIYLYIQQTNDSPGSYRYNEKGIGEGIDKGKWIEIDNIGM